MRYSPDHSCEYAYQWAGSQACAVERQTSNSQILLDVNGMTDEFNLLVKLASVQRVTNLILMVIAYRP